MAQGGCRAAVMFGSLLNRGTLFASLGAMARLHDRVSYFEDGLARFGSDRSVGGLLVLVVTVFLVVVVELGFACRGLSDPRWVAAQMMTESSATTYDEA